MRMMSDVFWNGMKRKSADLRGGRSALLLDARKQNEHILSVITDKNKKMRIL